MKKQILDIKEQTVHYRFEQLCAYLEISEATAWRLVKAGKLPKSRIGPKTLIWRKSDVDAYVLSCLEV